MGLPHGAVGWSAACECNIPNPDHTHLLFGLDYLLFSEIIRVCSGFTVLLSV